MWSLRFVAPIVTGDYAPVMRENVGVWLPSFKPDQVKLVKESYDFIGINYYTASYASVAPRTPGANVSYTTDQQVKLSGNYTEHLHV